MKVIMVIQVHLVVCQLMSSRNDRAKDKAAAESGTSCVRLCAAPADSSCSTATRAVQGTTGRQAFASKPCTLTRVVYKSFARLTIALDRSLLTSRHSLLCATLTVCSLS